MATQFDEVSGAALFALGVYGFMYARLVKKPNVKHSNDQIRKITDKCPSLDSLYWPSPLCWNAHTQFVPFMLCGLRDKIFPPFKWQREIILLPDGEEVSLDWVTGIPSSDATNDTPVLVLHHGAFCDSSDMPGQYYIQPALDRGWHVCALNRRGHHGSLTVPKWNFFGCVKDVNVVTQSILAKRPKAQLLTVGLSSGSGLVANIFGYGEINNFHCGVGVCPGYCIKKCMGRFGFPYMDFLLWRGKEFFLKANAQLLKHLPGYEACLNATNLQDWLEHSYAMAGFDSAEHYYDCNNPVNEVYSTQKPVMFINSENDPLCVLENYHDQMPNIESRPCPVVTVITKTGSHCPFYEGLLMNCWSEKATFEFFDAYLSTLEK